MRRSEGKVREVKEKEKIHTRISSFSSSLHSLHFTSLQLPSRHFAHSPNSNYLRSNLDAICLSPRAQLLAPALVRRRVLRPVLLAAVRRHLALATRDVNICSFLALRVVADPSQLIAKALVLGEVPHGMVLAAVQRHSAPGTLLESFAELQVRGGRLARPVVASSGVLLASLCEFGEVVGVFLSNEWRQDKTME
jgi:hypothetical protein